MSGTRPTAGTAPGTGQAPAVAAAAVTKPPLLLLISTALTVLIPYGQLQDTSLKFLVPVAATGLALCALLKRRGGSSPSLAFFGWVLLVTVTSAVNQPDVFYLSQHVLYLSTAVAATRYSQDAIGLFYLWISRLAVLEAFAAIAEIVRPSITPIFGAYPDVAVYGGRRVLQVLYGTIVSPTEVRTQGTLGHPLVLATVLLFGLAILLNSQVFSRRGVQWVCTLAVCVALVSTGSTSALMIGAMIMALSLARSQSLAILMRIAAGIAALTFVYVTVVGTTFNFNNRAGVELEYNHRLNSIYAVPHIIQSERIWNIAIGNGAGSAPRLYTSGVIPNIDNFFAIDNQYVTLITEAGLIGLGLFVAATWVAFGRGDRVRRMMLGAALGMFFSFDLLSWTAITVIMTPMLATRASGRTSAAVRPVGPIAAG